MRMGGVFEKIRKVSLGGMGAGERVCRRVIRKDVCGCGMLLEWDFFSSKAGLYRCRYAFPIEL